MVSTLTTLVNGKNVTILLMTNLQRPVHRVHLLVLDARVHVAQPDRRQPRAFLPRAPPGNLRTGLRTRRPGALRRGRLHLRQVCLQVRHTAGRLCAAAGPCHPGGGGGIGRHVRGPGGGRLRVQRLHAGSSLLPVSGRVGQPGMDRVGVGLGLALVATVPGIQKV